MRFRGRTLLLQVGVVPLVLIAIGLSACGGNGDQPAEPAETATGTSKPAAVQFERVVDTPATAQAASSAVVSPDELQSQIDSIARGLKDGGFDATNAGEVGEAKADFVIDTSWGVYLYESESAAAEFVLGMKDIREDEANFELFRVGNRVYFATMETPLTAEDKAKLDEIAKAVEGAVATT